MDTNASSGNQLLDDFDIETGLSDLDDISFDDDEIASEEGSYIERGSFEEVLDTSVSNAENTQLDDFDADFSDLEGTTPAKNIELEAEYSPEDLADGAIVHDDLLEEDFEQPLSQRGSEFISENGNIVVQVADEDPGTGFELEYIDIENIAITPRIRAMKSVEGLIQSIQSTGLLQPIVVADTSTEGLKVLLDGYRRLQACARAGKTKIPCIVNKRVNTPEIPILEAMYNHSQKYSVKEQVDYIKYLETEKGIMNPAMIEYLLQMNNGDYTKLKDILNDNDEDIVSKLYDGQYDIATAFRKLEQRRKKESQEEKENKRAAKVYDDEAESGAEQIQGSGEETDGNTLSEDQIKALSINLEDFADDVEESNLSEMMDEDSKLEAFKPHKQKVGEREYIDPIIKKAVMARDKNTCQCCLRHGSYMADSLDYHHILPVFLGGADTADNGIMLCPTCHRNVHLYSTDDLIINDELKKENFDELTDEQKNEYQNSKDIYDSAVREIKKIVYLGGAIRKGVAQRGMNKEQYKKEHSNVGIGRRKPGVGAEQEKT